MARVTAHLGYVLHRWDYRDTSLLVELFLRDRGRLPVVARGAKQPKRPWAALLQPFRPLWLALSGRGEVLTLRQVEPADPAHGLTGTLVFQGLYLNELLLRLLPRDDVCVALWERYQRTLQHLETAQEPESWLRHFECQLLQELGYGILCEQDARDGQPIQPQLLYDYQPELGPLRVTDNHPFLEAPLRLHGSTLLALGRQQPLSLLGRREARALLAELLRAHLGDRPLKSLELIPDGGDNAARHG